MDFSLEGRNFSAEDIAQRFKAGRHLYFEGLYNRVAEYTA